jgi:5-methylcytosine-specific restriction protein A
MMPTAEDFRVTLRARMQGAEHASKTTVEINSGQLHREVGGYPGQNHRMPPCCAVMRSEMSAGDAILQEPPKKQGASLTIRYNDTHRIRKIDSLWCRRRPRQSLRGYWARRHDEAAGQRG